jgi:hypothetical protein
MTFRSQEKLLNHDGWVQLDRALDRVEHNLKLRMDRLEAELKKCIWPSATKPPVVVPSREQYAEAIEYVMNKFNRCVHADIAAELVVDVASILGVQLDNS